MIAGDAASDDLSTFTAAVIASEAKQ